MSEREPTLRDVLGAVNELRGEMGEVRIGLGDVRGRLDRVDGRLDGLTGEVAEQGRRLDALTGKVTEQGHRLDRVDGRLDGLTGEVKTLGRETRELRTELPVQVVAGVLVGFERSAYATDLRTLAGGGSRVESRRGRVEASFGRVARKTWTNTPERASCRGYQIADFQNRPAPRSGLAGTAGLVAADLCASATTDNAEEVHRLGAVPGLDRRVAGSIRVKQRSES